MLVHGMLCYCTGWCVSIRDGVLVYGRGDSISYTIWSVSIRNGVLVYGMGC